MAPPIIVGTSEDLRRLRELLLRSSEQARAQLMTVLEQPDFLRKLKFQRIGCDPLDPEYEQNLAEQIDQQATYTVALDALEELMRRHPGETWRLAPGSHAKGHDIESEDRSVIAEVFAAVSPSNNRKLAKDVARVATTTRAVFRYVFFFSPSVSAREYRRGDVTVIALAPPGEHPYPNRGS